MYILEYLLKFWIVRNYFRSKSEGMQNNWLEHVADIKFCSNDHEFLWFLPITFSSFSRWKVTGGKNLYFGKEVRQTTFIQKLMSRLEKNLNSFGYFRLYFSKNNLISRYRTLIHFGLFWLLFFAENFWFKN